MIAGPTVPGTVMAEVSEDRILVNAVVLDSPTSLMRVGAWLDTVGSGLDRQAIAPVLYTAAGALVATGPAISLTDEPAGWRTLRWDEPGMAIAAGDYRYGFMAGPNTNHLRLARETAGASRRTAVAPYALGVPTTLPTVTTSTGQWSMFLETIAAPALAADDDDRAARLPFVIAQALLGASGVLVGTDRRGRAGWHGPSVDPERGSFAIVRTGGPFEDLVGYRLKVTRGVGPERKSVFVYCHDEQDWPPGITDEDVSLTGRAWIALALPSEESIAVTVEVAGG